MTKGSHVVLLVHGIRTRAAWIGLIKNTLQVKNKIDVFPMGYGYFDVFRFLFPFMTRNRPVKTVERKMRAALKDYSKNGSKISIIAHSFGTYIVTRILQEQSDIDVDNLLLCGSIVKIDYDWTRAKRQVKGTVLNDCASLDYWPVLASSFTWGFGSSGTYGFQTPNVEERIHPIRHSDFFKEEFVKKYWVPFIHHSSIVPRKANIEFLKSPKYFWFLGLPFQWCITICIIVFIIYAFSASNGDGNISDLTQAQLERCDRSRKEFIPDVHENSVINYFIKTATSEYTKCAREIGGDNRGIFVEEYLTSVGLPPGEGWVAAYVSWCMMRAGLDKKEEIISGTSKVLYENFQTAGLIIQKDGNYRVGDIIFMKGTRYPGTIYPAIVVKKVGEILDIVLGNDSDNEFNYKVDMVTKDKIPVYSGKIEAVARFLQ